jgi:hypothetical protein
MEVGSAIKAADKCCAGAVVDVDKSRDRVGSVAAWASPNGNCCPVRERVSVTVRARKREEVFSFRKGHPLLISIVLSWIIYAYRTEKCTATRVRVPIFDQPEEYACNMFG